MQLWRQLREGFDRSVQQFCTSARSNSAGFKRPGCHDQELQTWLEEHITSVNFDGAPVVQKLGRNVAGSKCKHTSVVAIDYMHEVCNLFVHAIESDPSCKAILDQLVSNERSHVKQTIHPFKYRRKWQAAQREVIKKHGCQGGGLTIVLENRSVSVTRVISMVDGMEATAVTLIASLALLVDEAVVGKSKCKSSCAETGMFVTKQVNALLVGMIADMLKLCMWHKNEADEDYLGIALLPRLAKRRADSAY